MKKPPQKINSPQSTQRTQRKIFGKKQNSKYQENPEKPLAIARNA
jgi:hypothetical protein